MKCSVYESQNGLKIEYIFSRSKQQSDALVVAFPAPAGGMRGGEWGYLFTINQIADVNVLFIRTTPDYSKSRMTYCNGEPLIENAVVELVNKLIRENGIKDVTAIGSSMGGYCSLYYGLKYNWNIIAGSAPYDFADRSDECFAYAAGNAKGKDKRWLNDILPSVVRTAGNNGYKKKLFVMWGEGEALWKNPVEGKRMLKDMDDVGIEYMYSLYPFSDHQTICELFPNVLTAWLKYYLGKGEKPRDVDEINLSSKAKFISEMDSLSEKILFLIQEIRPLDVNTDISDCPLDGDKDKWVALRNYVYIKEGWYWGFGSEYTEPQKIYEGKDIFKIPLRNGDKNILTFYFHSTLLRLFLKNKDANILKWLLDNTLQYFLTFNYKQNSIKWMEPEDNLQRMYYFIQLYKQAISYDIQHECLQHIPEEIKRCISYAVQRRNRFFTPALQLRIVLGLFHCAVCFRQEKIYDDLCKYIFELLRDVLDYHFDENGVCISGQMYYQDVTTIDLRKIMLFIQNNKIEGGRLYKSINKKYGKILEYTSHTDQFNGRMPAIGHTSYRLRDSRSWLKHAYGNFIKQKSNIAILEDNISHLTVNGGSNIHCPSRWKHCDLLSFTWLYDGKRIFCDAGGTGTIMADYVASSIAHTAFICDDINYATPDYEDWTTIDEVEEKDGYVMISMSHRLIDGVLMKRKFMWIKPNIIILLDQAESEDEHDYSQNFMMDKAHVIKKDSHRLSVKVEDEIEVGIAQYVQNEKYDIKMYEGTADNNDVEHYRGSLLDNWATPHKGVNIVFTLHGRKAVFVTAIECHSKKSEIAAKERKIRKLYSHPERGLVVEFDNVDKGKVKIKDN